ncbi:MAG: hypothetical protein E6J71_29770 [Deltaproteobacteria bacterium]|nr:MAG: hypothetical protein E6J71_29770 [Deltaproteobacteria bacterium]
MGLVENIVVRVIVLHDGDLPHHRSLERCRDRPNAAATVRLLVPALAARGLHAGPLPEVLGLAGVSRAVAPPAAGR